MKKILIKTPRGEYHLDLEFVAENRANYYAEVDNVKIGGSEWKTEVSYVMNSDYEGIDWLNNNMDWEDVEHVAKKINDDVHITDDDFWGDSDGFEMV